MPRHPIFVQQEHNETHLTLILVLLQAAGSIRGDAACLIFMQGRIIRPGSFPYLCN